MPTRRRGVHRLAPDSSERHGTTPARNGAVVFAVVALVGGLCAVGWNLLRAGVGGDGSQAATGYGATATWSAPRTPAAGTPATGTLSAGTPTGHAAPSSTVIAQGRGVGSPSPQSSAARHVVTPSPRPAPSPTVPVPAADRLAGITALDLRPGTGSLSIVPGATRPTGRGRVMRVRVEVEGGIGVDGPTFARFVMNTLTAPQGWQRAGLTSFVRTDGGTDLRLVLVSPATYAKDCPGQTSPQSASCGAPGTALITMFRWLRGTPEYSDDLTAYREYLVNHEIGHLLGRPYGRCTPGHLAPVMMRQTNGLLGCLRNPWPYPQ